MGELNSKKSVNFLRGVPAEEALSKLIMMEIRINPYQFQSGVPF